MSTKSLNHEQIQEAAQQLADTYFNMSTSAVGAILGMAKAVYEGSQSEMSKRKVFREFCRLTKIDPKSSTCRKYRKIGEHSEKLREFEEYLPSNWTTLYTLSFLDSEKLREAVDREVLHSSVSAIDLKRGLESLAVPLKSGAPKKRVPFTISIERGLAIEVKARILEGLEKLKIDGVHFGETLTQHLSNAEPDNV